MKKCLIILAIVLCFANAVRRLVYVMKNYNLNSLIAHERGSMK